MKRTELTAGWSLRPVGGPVPAEVPSVVPATVPGTVHTDLMAAGVIPDPYLDRNEEALAWIGESDFVYETTFEAAAGDEERIDLVAQGLDTVATVTLNGTVVGRTKNQHRGYRFDVREALREGENRLSVRFDSALAFARAAEKRIGARPYVGNSLPYNAVRKMACNFGWDWGPVLVTAGIWQPIALERWSAARIASVVPQVTVDADGTGRVAVRVTLERTSTSRVEVTARLTGPGGTDLTAVVPAGETTVDLDLSVPDAALWWPVGHGEQPLYDLRVSVADGTAALDEWHRSIGFRTVELLMEPDEFGTSFRFRVNGEILWIKGANWIPDDCFLPRITARDYADGVRDTVEAGMNMLRIWGGGIYESDLLYEECDRAGVMVWQDFLFACASYSEEPELWDEVEAEVRENVARLAPHPSLVMWNGSNENIEGYYEWGWKDALGEGVSWGRGYYDELLPSVLAEIDPTRPYAPSSPYSPTDYANPRDPDHGSVHSWEVWNRQDYTEYGKDIPRFVAEFGFQGPPAMSTLTAAVHDEPLAPDSPGVLAHQKAEDGNGKLARGYAPHLPEPVSFDDWHFTTQLNQALAIRYGVEHFRSHAPRTSGSIIWQLNDCWPVTSWAAVDSARRRKPLWYALRALNAERLLTVQPREEGTALVVSNDSAGTWTENLTAVRMSFDGRELARQVIPVEVPARTNVTVVLDTSLVTPRDPRGEVVFVESAQARPATWYFAEDRELGLPALDVDCEVTREDTGHAVRITARSFVKDLVLNADRLDAGAQVDDALLTLRPGDTHVLHVTSDAALDPALLTSHPVLTSVNTLLAHSRTNPNEGTTR
ncbi:glycoside hydrolase family 2 protein [Streptomyces sp. NPDC049954]|uniref:glycoside hydrolase family 2 protein n=1 Tax=Streptomyces sp. NPDC049954 TaxID=3155779 RepID=UPI00343177B3